MRRYCATSELRKVKMKTILKITLSLAIASLVLAGCATKQPPPSATPSIGQNIFTTNQQCIDIIKKFEGVRLNAYTGPGGHWLIDWLWA